MSYRICCTQHGEFEYRNSACPGCVNTELVTAQERLDKAVEDAGKAFPPSQRTRENKLSYLEEHDPERHREYLAQILAEKESEERERLTKERIDADLSQLKVQYGKSHEMGKPGLFEVYEILGACIVDGKRYARIISDRYPNASIKCIPWIDAFAARIGIKYKSSSDLKVCWEKKNTMLYVRDEDALIGDGFFD